MASLIYVDSALTQHTLSAIQYGSSTAAHIYLGSTQVWPAASAATWISMTSGLTYLIKYTPAATMSVASFSVILSNGTLFNATAGIWTLSGSTITPVASACVQTGITAVAGSTYSSKTQYTTTVTYTTKPTLTAGVTYYFHVGDRYQAAYILSGSNTISGYVQDWAFSATATEAYTANVLGQAYLNVVAG